jgi:hypothetical protein
MNQHDASLDAIEAVADQCVTSMTATAVRFAELTDSALAVIVSTNGIIDYCFMSEAMKSLPKLDWIRKGTPVPPGTATARLAGQPARVLAGERIVETVDVRDWLGGMTRAEVSEESMGLGNYGKVLTVLVSSSIGQEGDPDDEDDDEEVIERWTPRFRR